MLLIVAICYPMMPTRVLKHTAAIKQKGCPKSKFYDKEIQYIEINRFDEAIYCISY